MSLTPKFGTGMPTTTAPDWSKLAPPPPPPGATTLPPDQVTAILQREVATAVARGARVESVVGNQAVVVYGKPVNNVLHLLLTILLIGLWLIVWIILLAKGGETREMITVDEYGRVFHRSV